MRLGVVVVAAVTLAGCDGVFGLDGRQPIDAPPSELPADGPVCGAMSLNSAGCACETVGAVQNCFLGNPGPQSHCRVNGTVTCGEDKLWGTCMGANAPEQEVCFDAIDNDCDGMVDEGCTCANGENLCIDPATKQPFTADKLIINPNPVRRSDALTVIGLSLNPIPNPAFQSGAICTGSMTTCVFTGPCTGWKGVQANGINGSMQWFVSTGTQQIKVLRNSGSDGGSAPCNPPNPTGQIVGTVTVTN